MRHLATPVPARALLVLLAFLAIWTGFSASGLAQDAKALSVPPPLSQSFPLEVRPDGIGVRYPILLNDETILGADAVLHSVYIDQSGGLHAHGGGGDGGETMLGHHHRHGGGEVPPPAPGDSGASDAATPSDEAKGKIPTEVWSSLDPFREALDAPGEYDKILVYAVPGEAKPKKATVDFPDGMLLAEIDGRLRVLWLAPLAKALQSGIRPDDEIRSFQGAQGPVPVATLAEYRKAVAGARKTAANTGKAYVIDVWRPSEGKTVPISFSAPPSLNVPFF